MVAKTKWSYVMPGMWTYGTLRIRRIVTGGYWIYCKNLHDGRLFKDLFIPKIVLWTISRNGIKLRTTVSFNRARRMAKLFSQ